MEIVLQWIDELDDLVFVVASLWRRICRIGLALGLVAALVLTPVYSVSLGAHSVMVLCAVAAGSVLAWLTALLPAVMGHSPQLTSSA